MKIQALRFQCACQIKIGLGLILLVFNFCLGLHSVHAQKGSLNSTSVRSFKLEQLAEPPSVLQSGSPGLDWSKPWPSPSPTTNSPLLQNTSTYVGVPAGLSVPIQQNFGFAFSIEDRPDFFIFGEQITPQAYPATLTSVLYPSLNSAIKDDKGNPFPSAAGAKLRVYVFSADTDKDLSNASFDNLKQADFTITKDFSDPNQIKSYADFNEFDTSDITITKGSFFVMLQLISVGDSKLKSDGTDFMFVADIENPSKAVISINAGQTLKGVGVTIDKLPVDFLVVGRIQLSNGTVLPPEIQGIKLAKDSMTVVGTRLSLTGQLKVGDRVVFPPLTARLKKNGRLRVSGTQDQLNLKKGNNEIIFTEGSKSSPSYRLKLN